MYTPYQTGFKRKPDFRVRYRLYSTEEGGRRHLPFQGLRCDFWYPHPAHNRPDVAFMIWPEFLDESGEPILQKNIPMPQSGMANMWIVSDKFRPYHRDKIKVGTTGYFMEGAWRTAACEVTEMLSLLDVAAEMSYEEEMKLAMQDQRFVADMRKVMKDFKHIDHEHFGED